MAEFNQRALLRPGSDRAAMLKVTSLPRSPFLHAYGGGAHPECVVDVAE